METLKNIMKSVWNGIVKIGNYLLQIILYLLQNSLTWITAAVVGVAWFVIYYIKSTSKIKKDSKEDWKEHGKDVDETIEIIDTDVNKKQDEIIVELNENKKNVDDSVKKIDKIQNDAVNEIKSENKDKSIKNTNKQINDMLNKIKPHKKTEKKGDK